MPIIIGFFIAFIVFPTLVILLLLGLVLSCVIDATVGEYARKKIRIKCSDYLDEPRKKERNSLGKEQIILARWKIPLTLSLLTMVHLY